MIGKKQKNHDVHWGYTGTFTQLLVNHPILHHILALVMQIDPSATVGAESTEWFNFLACRVFFEELEAICLALSLASWSGILYSRTFIPRVLRGISAAR